MDGWKEGWTTCDFMPFSTVFQSYQDYKKLRAKESCLWLKKFLPPEGLKPGTVRSADQHLTLLHSERPKLYTILAFLSAIGLIY